MIEHYQKRIEASRYRGKRTKLEVDKEDPSSPPSGPSPLKGEGALELLTPSKKETSPDGERFPPFPKEILSWLLRDDRQ
jgi:hypothetical protein